MFRPTNITNQAKFPVSTQPYKAQISGFVDNKFWLGWQKHILFLQLRVNTSSHHFLFFGKKTANSPRNWSKQTLRNILDGVELTVLAQKSQPVSCSSVHFGVTVRQLLSSLFIFFIPFTRKRQSVSPKSHWNQQYSLSQRKTQRSTCFWYNSNFYLTSTRKSDFSLEISMLAVWSSDCWLGPYLCMLFEFVCYLNEWLNTCNFLLSVESERYFIWAWSLNQTLHIKNTKHKIFRDGNDRFICDIDSYGKSVVQNSHLVSHKQTRTINIQDMVVGFPSQGHKQTKTKTCALSLSVSDFLFWCNKKKLYSNSLLVKLSWHQETAILSSLFSHSSIPVFLLLLPSTLNKAPVGLNNHSILLTFRKVKKQERKSICKKPNKNKKTKQKCLSFSSALSLLFCVFGLAWIRLYITPKTKQKRSQITKKHKHKSVNPKQATRKTITQNQHGTQSWQNNLLLNSM